MKKAYLFIAVCVCYFLFQFQYASAADVDDSPSLNSAIIAASTNPAVNTINISTSSLVITSSVTAVSNKTIIFQSTSTSLIDGADTYGIFKAQNGSNLTFDNISFANAAAEEGAFLNIKASTASFSGSTTTFTGGSAHSGGAVSAKNNSYITFSSKTVFDSNSAIDYGGGFYSEKSMIVFDDSAEFKNNVSQYMGGGFYADAGSNISFNGHAYFEGNIAMENNGGGFFAHKSTINFSSAEFENNISSDIGGGFFSNQSNIVFNDTATFTGNHAAYSGGAASIALSDIRFDGNVLFSSNTSGNGGGIIASRSTITFSQDADFESNSASVHGGAIASDHYSITTFDGEASFKNNKALDSGGAIYALNSSVIFNSGSVFESNAAENYGGAIHIQSGNITLSDTLFDGNTAGTLGGAVYLSGTPSSKAALTVNTSSETVFQNNKAAGKSNALYLDDHSSAEFNTSAGAEVQMYDAVSGSGYDADLIISGAGRFNLYDELTGVDIRLSGSSGSSFNVMSGASIDAGKLLIGNGSKFSTVNNSADTIKVTSLDIDGILAMEISESGNHDQIISSGSVNLGTSSELEITTDLTDTNFRKKTYLIINTPEDVNTVFGTVTVTTPTFIYSPLINYGDLFKNWITITLRGDDLVTDFSSLSGLSFNQKQVAKTYDALSLTSSGDLDGIISLIEGMDENGQKKALAQASGYFLANIIRSAAVDAEGNEIYDRIKNHCLYGDTENGIWAQLRGAATTHSKDKNSLNDFKDTSSGVMIGFDRFMTDKKIMLGVYGKYNDHDVEQGDNEADINNTGIGIYGGLIEKEWEVKALISGSYDNYSTTRKILFAGRKAKADFDGTTFGADIEGALKFQTGEYINLRPYLGLEAKNSHYNGFKENGAESLALEVAGDSYIRSAARLGAGALYDDKIFSWNISAEIKYLLSGELPEIEASFKGSDHIFRSRGSEEGNIIFGAVAGGSVRITRELKLFVNGSYYGADNFQNLYGNIGFRWNFCNPQKESKPARSKKDEFDAALYLLAPVEDDFKEMDAVITFEEAPPVSQQEEEYDAALELLKSSEVQTTAVQPEEVKEGDYDAALELLKASQEPEPAEIEEINMEDEKVVEEQQREAALRRSKPVLKSFSLNMANFATGKSVLTEKAKDNIRLQAEEIKNFEFTKITIEGHTDSTGSAAVNKRLSRERAKAVFDVFVEEGIAAKKMSYIGFSSLLPVAPNNTIDGRARNRRVEIFVE